MKTKQKKQNSVSEVKPLEIQSAQLKDGLCNYSFEIIQGVGVGDTHNVKGKGIIDDDFSKAMEVLNVHLCCIDDAFNLSKVEVGNIDMFHNHLLVSNYEASGFKMKGGEGNQSVIITGYKSVEVGGRIDLSTPKILLENFSSYKWYNELKDAIESIRNEVVLYKDGKYTIPEEATDPAQLSIDSDMEANEV